MLLCTARRSVSSREGLSSSYVEISRFVRAFRFLVPLQRLADRAGPKCKSQNRGLHNGQFLYNNAIKKTADDCLLTAYKSTLAFPAATHEVGDLDVTPYPEHEVVLHGYIGSRTDLSKSFYFIQLLSKDLGHSLQIVSSAKSVDGEIRPVHEKLKEYTTNTPVAIRGRLKHRKQSPTQDVGHIRKIKSLELELQDVYALNAFPKDIIVTPETIFPLEQRHLQLKHSKKLRDALIFRAKVATLCRELLSQEYGFTEIETPLLFKSTPEGAREFVVPTRQKGMAYALPQSPQQFKQILIASGISRYYQLAKCFRDEDLRADRQPEFTQLDIEMSFATGADVMMCVEVLIQKLWLNLLDVRLPSTFSRITYQHAMSKFGSDKPDTRLGMEIHRVGHLLPVDLVNKISPLTNPIVDALILRFNAIEPDTNITRTFVREFLDSPDANTYNNNPDGSPGIFIYDSKKPLEGLQSLGFEAAEEIQRLFELEDGDLIVLQARQNEPFHGGSTPLGNLRVALHKAAVARGFQDAPKGFQPLWVTNFPLFSPISATEPGQGGASGLASTHHPFTSPKSSEDVDLLLVDPRRVIGDHYDLVMNGVEMGGGSRRIHNSEMQRFIMEKVLRMSFEKIAEFSHLLEVLRAGCPPHAGIALGFDRLIAVMLGKDSVRDVIAFPKSGKGEDLLVKSPSMMSKDVLETYHLQLRDNNKEDKFEEHHKGML